MVFGFLYLVENRPRCHARSSAASRTVEKVSPVKEPETIVATGRTLESQRTLLLNQMPGARLVFREFPLERQQAPGTRSAGQGRPHPDSVPNWGLPE